jgi:hypothetical protein
MPRFGRTASIAAIAVAGVAAVGGLSAAGALPSVSELSGGHSAVETVPPDTASQTGIDHAQAGGAAGVGADAGVGGQAITAPSDGGAGNVVTTGSDARLDGLTTAAGNVTSDNASAVIETIMANTPGPGFGAAVSDVASDGRSSDHPQPPEPASGGLAHKP